MGYVLPGWLDEILDFIGISWPNVDEDDYREMADAMRELADAFDGHAGDAHAAVSRLLSSSEGWAVDSLEDHWGKVKASHLDELPQVARLFADAMEVVADVIYAMKIKAEIELAAMAATVGISVGLAFVTGGLSALIGAAEITAMREVVRRLIKEAADQIVEQVMATVTEPVAAKLEEMVSDAILELAEDALSPADGGGAGATAMNLNSASGSSGGGPGGPGKTGRMRIDHGEHEKGAGDLERLTETSLARLTAPLDRAHGASGRTRGRDPFTAPIDGVVHGAVKGMKKAVTAVVKHTGETVPKNVRKTSDNHKRNERRAADELDKILKGRDGKGGPNSPAKGPDGPGGKHSGGKPTKSGKPNDPELSKKGRQADKKCLGGDPIDMANGEVFLSETDLTLPGVLPLVIKRTHLSNYRHGRFFGPSWASTLDERLESVQPGGAGELWWHRSDGSSLRYDHAPDLVGEEVEPREGRRLPLTCLQGTGGWDLAVYDARSGLTRRFLPSEGSSTVGLWWLMEIEDRNGNTLIIERDADGTPTSISHSTGGYHVAVDSEDAQVTALSVQTPEGEARVLTYGYDSDRNLAEVINSSGSAMRYGYDTDHRLTSWTDRSNSTFLYVYDDAGRVQCTIGPDGYLSSRLTYDPERQLTQYADSKGAVTSYYFNTLGQVISETDPMGHTTHTEWDRHDRVLSRTDPLGRATRFEYDQHDVVSITHPDGDSTQFTRNRHHLPTQIALPGGAIWHQEYDAFGNRISVKDPSGTITRFTYNELGHLVSFTNALDETTTVRCNGAGLPQEITDPSGAITRYRRDSFGRTILVTDPLGATTHLEWTVEGKLARRTAPDGGTQSWTYNAQGNCISHTDAIGSVSSFEYTHFDLMSARVGADGVRYEFEHDTELKLRTVINPQGLTWSYEYDQAGRLTSETDFDGRTLTYAHDVANQLQARTNALGQATTFERDTLGHIVAKDVAGQVTTYEYDPRGNLVRASGPDAILERKHNDAGRLISETVNNHTLSFSYDTLGRRNGRTTPAGVSSQWTYDAMGKIGELTTSGRSLTFEYDSVGNELVRHIGENLTLTNQFDLLGRLIGQELAGPTNSSIQHRSYTYRADGSVTTIDDQLGGSQRFDLDSAGRVTAVHAAAWNETYAYDEAGNQTQAAWPSPLPGQESIGDRTYTGTRIQRAGNVRYGHDAAGRVILRQKSRLSRKPETWRYAWDPEDRLTSVTTPDGIHWRYKYDPLGRRIAKQRISADSETVLEQINFSWDGTTVCEQTTHTVDSTEAVSITWDHYGLRPLAQTERKVATDQTDGIQNEIDSRFYAIVTDLIGTPTELLDEQGDIAWRSRTTLWGSTVWNRGATAYTPLRFPGQYFDPETQLHYNYARYYDPETARYYSPDPLGLSPAPNPVTYVDNPHTATDPLGLSSCPRREHFSVQSREDAARLRAGGEPWPNSLHRAHFGEGVYAWGSRSEAERYFAIKTRRAEEEGRDPDLEIMRFTISEDDFRDLNRVDISKMSDDEADAFIERYSLMSDHGRPDHGYDYITRPTGLGPEHFFSRSVMNRLRFDD